MATTITPPTPYSSASLYVGDLAPEVTEALLFEIFNAVGPVASVRVCRDAATRRSLGYAYVNYHRVEDAERALDTMNFKSIRNRACRIMWSQRDPSLRKSGSGNIFINNLAESIDNKQLCDTFSMFGSILSCKVATNSKGKSCGYGFVHYVSEEAANAAIQRVDGKTILGKKVSVSRFKSRAERGGGKDHFTNVYVKNFPFDWEEKNVKELFSKHGEITKMLLRKNDSKKNAYAFVNFKTTEQAKAAIEALNGFEIDEEVKLYVARHQKKEERERELRGKFDARKAEHYKQFRGVNLFVKNLADTIDDDRLNSEFSKFGLITSAKVMCNSEGKSKGFGFVCFNTPEEATKAVTELNGRMLDNKPLYVALAQRKEDRRAQLEAQYASRGKFNPQQAPQMYPGQAAPVFYPSMPQRPVMYPQQMVPGRWNPRGGPQMMGVPRAMNYQLMPINNGRPQPNQRGNQRGRGRGGKQPGQMQQQGNQQGQQLRFNSNVRNQQPQQPQNVMNNQQPPAQNDVVSGAAGAPLTIKMLAAAPEGQQKQMIGERLFPLIKAMEPDLAGKITGMLLEMDNGELIHLLESSVALKEKVNEALQVLSMHEDEEDDEDEDEDDDDEEED